MGCTRHMTGPTGTLLLPTEDQKHTHKHALPPRYETLLHRRLTKTLFKQSMSRIIRRDDHVSFPVGLDATAMVYVLVRPA